MKKKIALLLFAFALVAPLSCPDGLANSRMRPDKELHIYSKDWSIRPPDPVFDFGFIRVTNGVFTLHIKYKKNKATTEFVPGSLDLITVDRDDLRAYQVIEKDYIPKSNQLVKVSYDFYEKEGATYLRGFSFPPSIATVPAQKADWAIIEKYGVNSDRRYHNHYTYVILGDKIYCLNYKGEFLKILKDFQFHITCFIGGILVLVFFSGLKRAQQEVQAEYMSDDDLLDDQKN